MQMDDQAIHLLRSRLASARTLITPMWGQPSVSDLRRAEEHLTVALATLRSWLPTYEDVFGVPREGAVANHRVDVTEPLDPRRSDNFGAWDPFREAAKEAAQMSANRDDTLRSALSHLKETLGLFVEAQTPGGQVPSLAVLERAARLTAEAHLQFEHLLQPPDPYADKALRPGLNMTVGEAAASGMVAPPKGG
jgi:hypothetical protein